MQDLTLKQRLFQSSLVGHGIGGNFGVSTGSNIANVDYTLKNKESADINDVVIKVKSPTQGDLNKHDPCEKPADSVLSSAKEGYVFRPFPKYQRVFCHLENGILTLVDPVSPNEISRKEHEIDPNKIMSLREDNFVSSKRGSNTSEVGPIIQRGLSSSRPSIPSIALMDSLHNSSFATDHINLMLYSVAESKDGLHSFELTNQHHSLTLQAANEPEMREWMSAIQHDIALLNKFNITLTTQEE